MGRMFSTFPDKTVENQEKPYKIGYYSTKFHAQDVEKSVYFVEIRFDLILEGNVYEENPSKLYPYCSRDETDA